MPTNMTALFETKYNGEGLSQAKRGFVEYESGIQKANGAAATLGGSSDSLIKKLERPLGRETFRSLASSILMSSGAMNGAGAATGPLAAGFHALGAAASFASPEIAGVAIVLLGLVTIYNKVSSATKDSAENIRKRSEEMLKDAESAKQAAEALKTLNTINDKQYRMLKDIGAQKENDVKALQQEISLKLQKKQLETEELKRQVEIYTEGGKGASVRLDLHKALKEEAELKKALISIGTTTVSLADDENQKLQKQMELRNQQLEMSAKLKASHETLAQATDDLKRVELEKDQLEQQFLTTTDPKKGEAIYKHIQALEAESQAYQQQIDKLKADSKNEESVLKQRGATLAKYASAAENAWEVHGKKIVFNSRKFLGEELKLMADQAAVALAIAAAKYFGTGNFAMGAAALAGAAAVKALAGAGAAALEAQGNTSDVASAASTAGAPSSASMEPAVPPAANQKNMSLEINIHGNVIGNREFVQNVLIPEITRAVQDRDAFLVSTVTKPAFGAAT